MASAISLMFLALFTLEEISRCLIARLFCSASHSGIRSPSRLLFDRFNDDNEMPKRNIEMFNSTVVL